MTGETVSSMKSHPGWNEELASDSEVAVRPFPIQIGRRERALYKSAYVHQITTQFPRPSQLDLSSSACRWRRIRMIIIQMTMKSTSQSFKHTPSSTSKKSITRMTSEDSSTARDSRATQIPMRGSCLRQLTGRNWLLSWVQRKIRKGIH